MVMRYRSLPSPGALIALEAVVRHSSFAAAARELSVSASAISQQVRMLEVALGVELVFRQRPRIRPTPAGQAIADAVRVGMDHVVDAVELVRRRARPGALTVAATTSFSSFWLMPRMPAFHAAHPEVELHLLTSDAELEPSRADYDIGVVFSRDDWPEHEERHLFADEIVPVCHPDYLSGRPAITDPEALGREVLLHHDFTNPTWMNWDRWFASCGVRPGGAGSGPHFSNYLLLVQAAVEGQGIAMGWRRLVEPLLERGDLVGITDTAVVPEPSYRVVMPAGQPSHEAACAFRDWLLDEAANDW